ncbi:hypothetical protein [Ahrensia marina]|uniref:Uncharacterized protein n=1 Tax=Ahrensia marina TaxID=1514904 RepID=A0A0N0E7Q5_9HYPH|nr:hypothetical protein [Ahrensia marina]KPB01362.1 hypothetical protein SU32_08925 [Ahrensia marina]
MSILDDWIERAETPKTLGDWPAWEAIAPRGRDAKHGPETRLASMRCEKYEFVVPLATASSLLIQGLRLRMLAPSQRKNEDLVANLESLYQGKFRCIARIEFWPESPHFNKHWKRLGIQANVQGSHVHSTRLNSRLGEDAFLPFENLPCAEPIDEPTSFREAVNKIETIYNISGLKEIEAPPWNDQLF